MKLHKIILFIPLLMPSIIGCAQEIPNKEAQIKGAILAAPEEKREQATVYGYDAKGKVVLLKEGTNEMVCLADNPAQKGFSVSCYHKDLQPFMARGHQLREEGKTGDQIFEMRESEVKAGTLKMPSQPTTLHVLTGEEGSFDPVAGTAKGANLRYVVYIPFATSASTGLPERPIVPGGPWIMDPGTHRAHIMITPPATEEGQ